MILILLFLVAAYIIYLHHKTPERQYGRSESIGFAYGASFIGLIFAWLILNVCGKFNEIGRVDQKAPIYSLLNKSELSGSFVLGSGNFGNYEQYFFFRKDERGGFYRETVSAQNAFIFENSEVEPNMFWQRVTYGPSSWLVPPFLRLESTRDTKYDLTVPKGTIIQKFEVK